MSLWYNRTESLTIQLTRFFSQTNSPGETGFATFLQNLLSQWEYFRLHPDHLIIQPTQSDPFDRCVLLARVQGTGPQTLILTGHYDVVGVENYGSLAEWACDPLDLQPRLISYLQELDARQPGLSSADKLALDDIMDGKFLPGRGVLDMKSGLAAGLAVLERFSQMPQEERKGNLLFIAVPDEEIASHGARTAALLLPHLEKDWGIELSGVINLDASNDHGSGSQGQTVYLGSVGKLLPSVYFVGVETHAGAPFGGFNPTLAAAELTHRIECNPDFTDSLDHQYTAPPTCLKQIDTKDHYDVTLPGAAWCYYNWLLLRRSVGDTLDIFVNLAQQALDVALDSRRTALEDFAKISHQNLPLLDWQPKVYTYAEIKAIAIQQGGKQVSDQLEELERRLAQDASIDTPTCCLRLTQAAWSASGLSGPAAVVGFAALFYPPAFIGEASGLADRFRQVIIDQSQRVSREQGTPIALHPFFPGISDISFFGGRVSNEEMSLLRVNTPAWNHRTNFDYTSVTNLHLPTANIGPWGRDYHQRTERVFMPYSFETLPELLWQVATGLLTVV